MNTQGVEMQPLRCERCRGRLNGTLGSVVGSNGVDRLTVCLDCWNSLDGRRSMVDALIAARSHRKGVEVAPKTGRTQATG